MDVKKRKKSDGRPANFPAPKTVATQASEETPKSPASKRRIVFKRPSKKMSVIGLIGVFIVGIFTIIAVNSWSESPVENNEPGYQAILPEGRSIKSLGGWQRVSPPGKDPVYAYNDRIGDTDISISQQPLPDSFKGSVSTKLSELAKSYNATNKLQAGDTTLYLGVSSKGPQSVIFTKEGLLVLVKSEKKVADSEWSAYVSSLSSSNLDNLPKY